MHYLVYKMHKSTSSLSAWLVKWHAREALLKVKILDIGRNCTVAFVLQELRDGLVNLGSEHLLRI